MTSPSITPYDRSRWETFKEKYSHPSSPKRSLPPLTVEGVLRLLQDYRDAMAPTIVAARQEQDQEPSWKGATSMKLGEIYRRRDLLDDLVTYLKLFGLSLPPEEHRLFTPLSQIIHERRLILK